MTPIMNFRSLSRRESFNPSCKLNLNNVRTKDDLLISFRNKNLFTLINDTYILFLMVSFVIYKFWNNIIFLLSFKDFYMK